MDPASNLEFTAGFASRPAWLGSRRAPARWWAHTCVSTRMCAAVRPLISWRYPRPDARRDAKRGIHVVVRREHDVDSLSHEGRYRPSTGSGPRGKTGSLLVGQIDPGSDGHISIVYRSTLSHQSALALKPEGSTRR